VHLLVSVHLYSQQPFVCLQADDTESAPLLADAAAVVLSSPPSQVIKDEVHATKPPDSFDIVPYHLSLYGVPLVQHAVHVPARVMFSLDCCEDFSDAACCYCTATAH
jgi:hypothetical protein